MNAASMTSSVRLQRTAAPLSRRAGPVRAARSTALVVRATGERGSGFLSGFVVGGVVFGALGFIFAPQISRAILGEDDRLRLPKFLDVNEKQDLEATRQSLTNKIAQLNAAIDDVSAQLKSQPQPKEEVKA